MTNFQSSCDKCRKSSSGRALNKRRSSRSHSLLRQHSQELVELHFALNKSKCLVQGGFLGMNAKKSTKKNFILNLKNLEMSLIPRKIPN
jgi:hypothetical protein